MLLQCNSYHGLHTIIIGPGLILGKTTPILHGFYVSKINYTYLTIPEIF